MHVQSENGSWGSFASENLALFLFEEETPESYELPEELLNLIRRTALDSGDFLGKSGEILPIYSQERPRRIFLIGLGKREEFERETFRKAVGNLIEKIQEKQREIALALRRLPEIEEEFEIAQTATCVAGLASYKFDYYFRKNEHKSPQKLETLILWGKGFSEKDILAGARRGKLIVEATNLARDLANHPANVATPTMLAAKAKEMEVELGVKTTILSRRQIEQLGMGAFGAVARGSREEPKFIVMEHGEKFAESGTIVFVGKGITFDSGGISIKPSKNMDEMKYDMAGGAAVFGLLWAAARLEIPLHVVGLVPATENLPDGHAYKPGDIVTSFSGQTIEVLNTDAEGRLILADALTYAQKYFSLDVLIDLATLTGAAVVALGHAGAAVMGNSEEVLAEVREAAERTGEKVWPIPLWKEYHEQLKSPVADMKNIGGGPGGLPVAGAFLENFVEIPRWVHLDIAGVAWSTEKKAYLSKGATGFGVRLLTDFLLKRAEKGMTKDQN